LFNENTRTVNIGGAAGSVIIGESSASLDIAADVASYTSVSSFTTSVNLETFTKSTNASTANGTAVLYFADTTNIRYGQVVTVVAGTIPASTYVTGFGSSGEVYISANVTSTITSATTVTFQETPVSVGISIGDFVTIASSGITNLDGTWPVTGATSTSNSFTIGTTEAVTAAAVTQVGTIVRLNSVVLSTRTLVVGPSGASGSPVAATIKGQDGTAGTAGVTGSDLIIQPGLGTGLASSGSFVVRTGTGGITPNRAPHTAADRLTINSTTATFTVDVAVNGGDLTTSSATFNVGNTATTTHTTNLVTAATASGQTKTINIGTGSAAGSTTTINIGSTLGTSTVNINGDLTISGASIGTSPEVTGITSAAATTVDSWAVATYRVVKYIVSVTCTAGTDVNTYQTSELLVIHDGTTATLTEYAVVKTGSNELITFTCDISAGNVRLRGQATTGNTVKVRPNRTLVNI
jgi:hypothetical protein